MIPVPRPRRIDLYLARTVLVSTLGAWLVLLGFDLISALVNELDELGQGDYSLGHAIAYVAWTAPRRAYDMFPIAGLIGSVLGLGALAGRSELTAMRAIGLSRLRIGMGGLGLLAVLTAVMMLNAETVVPMAEQNAADIVSGAKTGDVALARVSGLWAREGNIFINARDGVSRERDGRIWTELRGIRLYEFDDEGRLLSLAEARLAEHDGHRWRLLDVVRVRFAERGASREEKAEEHWDSELDGPTLAAATKRPRYLSSAEIRRQVAYLERNGLETKAYENVYWARWFYPLNVAVLCISALPFAFGSLRSGGFGKRLFIAIVIGIAYLLAQRLVVSLSDVYRFDARLAYIFPPAALMALSWGIFGRRE